MIICSVLQQRIPLDMVTMMNWTNRSPPICRRTSLLVQSLGVVETSLLFVCLPGRRRQMIETWAPSVLKEMDERWMESGEGLPRLALSGQRRTSSPTGGFVGVHVWFYEFPPRRHSLIIYRILLTSRFLLLLKSGWFQATNIG